MSMNSFGNDSSEEVHLVGLEDEVDNLSAVAFDEGFRLDKYEFMSLQCTGVKPVVEEVNDEVTGVVGYGVGFPLHQECEAPESGLQTSIHLQGLDDNQSAKERTLEDFLADDASMDELLRWCTTGGPGLIGTSTSRVGDAIPTRDALNEPNGGLDEPYNFNVSNYEQDPVAKFDSITNAEIAHTNASEDSMTKNKHEKLYTSGVDDYNFEEGMIFESKGVLKQLVMQYSAKNTLSVHFVKDDKVRLRAYCAEDCPFMLYAKEIPENPPRFVIRKVKMEHTCGMILDNKFVTHALFVKKYISVFRTNLNLTFANFKEMVEKDCGKSPSKSQFYRTKNKCLKLIKSGSDEQYNILKNCVPASNNIKKGRHGMKMRCRKCGEVGHNSGVATPGLVAVDKVEKANRDSPWERRLCYFLYVLL